jgi:hypothetical protein
MPRGMHLFLILTGAMFGVLIGFKNSGTVGTLAWVILGVVFMYVSMIAGAVVQNVGGFVQRQVEERYSE